MLEFLRCALGGAGKDDDSASISSETKPNPGLGLNLEDAVELGDVKEGMKFSEVSSVAPEVGVPVPDSMSTPFDGGESVDPPPKILFKDVGFKVKSKELVKGVSGIVPKGTMTAILGPSGAGKTTCLNVLARRLPAKCMKGKLWVDGCPLSHCEEAYVQSVGYSTQVDYLYENLTPRETLYFSSLLGNSDVSWRQRGAQVQTILKKLRLTRVQNSYARQLSGGERKRLNIGAQLIRQPDILFLDEPTSGLDSAAAADLLMILDTLCKDDGVTVVMTIHQPAAKLFDLFDNLLLLALGRLYYSGPRIDAVPFFAEFGYTCPEGWNVADFFIEVLEEVSSGVMRLDNASENRREMALRSRSAQESAVEQGNHLWGPLLKLMKTKATERQEDPDLQKLRSTYKSSFKSPVADRRASTIRRPSAVVDDGKGKWNCVRRDLLTGKLVTDETKMRRKLKTLKSVRAFDEDHRPTHKEFQEKYALTEAGKAVKAALDKVAGGQTSNDDDQHVPVKGGKNPLWAKLKPQRYAASWPLQFCVVFYRKAVIARRSPMIFWAQMINSVLVALVSGSVWVNVSSQFQSFSLSMGFLMFLVTSGMSLPAKSVDQGHFEREMFLIERDSNVVRTSAYYCAHTLVNLPVVLMNTMLLIVCSYFLMGYNQTSGTEFAFFVWINLLFAGIFDGFGYTYGFWFEELGVADSIMMAHTSIGLMFSGIFVVPADIPNYYVWAKWLSCYFYAYGAMAVNEFTGTSNESYLAAIGQDGRDKWRDLYILIGWFVAVRVLAFLTLRFRRRKDR